MVTFGMLLIPIIGSAVLVFFASAIIHMVLPYHKPDYRKLPDEEAVRTALLNNLPGPGQYVIPWCSDMKEMASPEMIAKQNQGPNALLFLRPNGVVNMGGTLGKWFAVCLLISATTACLARQVLPAGSTYMTVFGPVATAAFMAYGYANLAHSIWGGRPWIIAIKELFDALVYGCLTAGMFGWRWPH
jgi:hypothetical protein